MVSRHYIEFLTSEDFDTLVPVFIQYNGNNGLLSAAFFVNGN